jgi:hypothetical protein
MPRLRMELYLNALIINFVLSEPMHTPASARFLSVISTPGWEYVEPWKYWSNESAMFGARQILTPVGPFHVDVFSSAGKVSNFCISICADISMLFLALRDHCSRLLDNRVC